jgi:uncharacterized damage-inducible protein DinB
MSERRIPDPTLMARLPLSVKGVEWAATLLEPHAHERREEMWSPHQHLFHLVANENIFLERLQKMLGDDHPKFLRWDSEGFMKTNYKREPGIADLAAQFVDKRAAGVEILKGIKMEEWARTATWPDGRVVDVAWVAEKMLWHGLDHFATLLDIHGDLEPLQGGGTKD